MSKQNAHNILSFDQLLFAGALPGQVRTDSRQVQPGDIFVALLPAAPGSADNRVIHMADAAGRGAKYIIGEGPLVPNISPAIWLETTDARQALALLAQKQYATQNLPFPIIAVTGTNGKTTSVYMLEHLYRSAGKQVGVLGTVSYRWPGFEQDAPLTTPDCLTIHKSLAAMRDCSVGAACMEVSSHAIDQNRVAGLTFKAALFTNLTQDHLDYHSTMDDYYAAKAKLFTKLPATDKIMAINADDPYGQRLLAEVPAALGFSLEQKPGGRIALQTEVISETPHGMSLRVSTKDRTWEMTSPLVGRHNAANLCGVMTLALNLGFSIDSFTCFHDFHGVSGRLERIPLPEGSALAAAGTGIFVDYAHTPDALLRAQSALRGAGFKRLITVFGCGGDRDRGKRPLMGKAVAENCDIAIVTSDNPRTENPECIIDDIMPGLVTGTEVHRESDRRRALALGLQLLRPADALLVAGKGHESYQIIGTQKQPFCDQGILRELLNESASELMGTAWENKQCK